MKYEKPTAELLVFDNSDVITTSGCDLSQHSQGKGCPKNAKLDPLNAEEEIWL